VELSESNYQELIALTGYTEEEKSKVNHLSFHIVQLEKSKLSPKSL
jgi:hypothetical protein